jgi:hypothetical protein
MQPTLFAQGYLERQIMDFLGDHVWTINRNGLVQAVYFELGRTLWGGAILVSQARWIHEQIRPYDHGDDSDFEGLRTLILRIFQCLQASLILSAADESLVHSLLKQLFEGRIQWYTRRIWVSGLALIPTRYSYRYLGQLCDALERMKTEPEEDHYTVQCLTSAIAAGWPGNDRAYISLDTALTIALNWSRNWYMAVHLVSAMAAGWPGNDRAFICADKVLTKSLQKHDTATEILITGAMARGWPGRNNLDLTSRNTTFKTAWEEPLGSVTRLNIEQQESLVRLSVDEVAIKNWCGERGEKWGLEGDPEFAIVRNAGAPEENEKPKAILIVPRERIRRGLNPDLLHRIWQEQPQHPGTFEKNNTQTADVVNVEQSFEQNSRESEGSKTPPFGLALPANVMGRVGEVGYELLLGIRYGSKRLTAWFKYAGIAKDKGRPGMRALDELLRFKLVHKSDDRYPIYSLTSDGRVFIEDWKNTQNVVKKERENK